jgi:hypothetical protein
MDLHTVSQAIVLFASSQKHQADNEAEGPMVPKESGSDLREYEESENK